MPTTHYQIKRNGYSVKFGSKRVATLFGTLTVTVINNSDCAQFSSITYTVRSRSAVVIPVAYIDGADMTCISVSQGTVTQSGIALQVATADITVVVTNAKAKVVLSNSFSAGVDSIAPATQYVPFGTTATATIGYAAGYSADNVAVSAGTVAGNTWTIDVGATSISATLSERMMHVSVTTDLPYIGIGAIPSDISYGDSLDVPITYTDGSDSSCVSTNYGTIDSVGVHVASVTSDLNISISPTKAQVKVVDATEGTLASVVPTAQYVAPQTYAVFTLTYASGKSEADVRIVGDGTLSGNTLTVVAANWVNDVVIANSAIESVTIAGRTYPVVKIGTQYWMADNLRCRTSDSMERINGDTDKYGRYYSVNDIRTTIPNLLQNEGLSEWRVPSINDTNQMLSFVYADSGISPSYASTLLYKTSEFSRSSDRYGLSLVKNGFYNGGWRDVDNYAMFGEQTPSGSYANRLTILANTSRAPVQGDCGSAYSNIRMGIRLIRDV